MRNSTRITYSHAKDREVLSETGNVVTELSVRRGNHEVLIDVRWQDASDREPFIAISIDGTERKYRLPEQS